MTRALISGISGQDGSYLAEFLLAKPDYRVHGLVRPSSAPMAPALERLRRDARFADRLTLHLVDLADASALAGVVARVKPDEVYNLGAQSHVRVSFDVATYTADVDGLGALRLLEAVRRLADSQPVKFYQASSAEMFGSAPPPQGPDTPFHPRSPYACAKLYAHWQTVNYREAYGLFACSGILFNHESPRRGESFVTRKITLGAARIKEGLQDKLILGNLDSRRDWGFAGCYVRAMWMMLQAPRAADYIVATGEAHTVREVLEIAFGMLDLDYRDFVEFDRRFTRPAEVDYLLGDASRIRADLGWSPRVDFHGLIGMMVEHDLEQAERERLARRRGLPADIAP